VRLIPRHGKYSAEYYLYDPDTQKRTRKVKSTGVRIDGTRISEQTAATIGRRYEAEANGAHGHARARAIRRTEPLTLAAAYSARIDQIRAKGRSETSVKITKDLSIRPMRHFGHERDLDREPITDADLVRYAAHALVRRKPSSVHRELIELICGIRALNKLEPASMQLDVPKMPDMGKIGNAVELWLTTEQTAAMYAHVDVVFRDHFLTYRMLGLSAGEIYEITLEDIIRPGRTNATPRQNAYRERASEGVLYQGAALQVRVRGSKRVKRDRVLPVPARVVEVLERRARDARPGVPLFEPWPNSSRALTRAAHAAEVVPMGYREGVTMRRTPGRYSAAWRVSVAVLRASYCTELVLAGVHAKKIAELMGHTTTAMVERVYSRVRAGEHLADVVALVSDPTDSDSGTDPTTK
jgi:integrase